MELMQDVFEPFLSTAYRFADKTTQGATGPFYENAFVVNLM